MRWVATYTLRLPYPCGKCVHYALGSRIEGLESWFPYRNRKKSCPCREFSPCHLFSCPSLHCQIDPGTLVYAGILNFDTLQMKDKVEFIVSKNRITSLSWRYSVPEEVFYFNLRLFSFGHWKKIHHHHHHYYRKSPFLATACLRISRQI